MTQVLVTGGAGFIGAHLVRALVRRGDIVRVVDSMVTGTARNLSLALDIPLRVVQAALAEAHGKMVPLTDRCEILIGDIRNPAVMAEACAGADVVFHQAALRSVPRSLADPFTTHEVNASGTLRVFEAARAAGVRRVVFASSSSVYGDTPLPKHEGQVPQPKSPYAASKLAGEAYCQACSRAFGLSTIALRYFNVFGPWQDPSSEYAAVIPKFIHLALRRAPVPVYGDGTQSRDFTFVENVVDANLAAAEASVSGVAVNLGSGRSYSVLDLIRYLTEMLGYRVQYRLEPTRPGDVLHSQADISLARELIGYAPRVDFVTGLKQTVQAMALAEEHLR